VVSDVLGKAARQMIEALIAGECHPHVLAELALTRMRPKIPELRLALEGGFSDAQVEAETAPSPRRLTCCAPAPASGCGRPG
jgi:hypothetical protein